MNKFKFLMVMFIATGLVFSSCKKDEEDTFSKPLIKLNELGHENSKKVEAGKDLHVEANITAEGKISQIIVEIHQEGHTHNHKSVRHEGLEIEKIYSEFSGLKSTSFHKHIDIPETTEEGHYHFHFKVRDMEGQESVISETLEITAKS